MGKSPQYEGMTETETLLSEIESFLAVAEMAESTFGRKAVNDGKLLSRLRTGRSSVTLETAAQIRSFIKNAALPQQTTGDAA